MDEPEPLYSFVSWNPIQLVPNPKVELVIVMFSADPYNAPPFVAAM